jgi:hypothetical protein
MIALLLVGDRRRQPALIIITIVYYLARALGWGTYPCIIATMIMLASNCSHLGEMRPAALTFASASLQQLFHLLSRQRLVLPLQARKLLRESRGLHAFHHRMVCVDGSCILFSLLVPTGSVTRSFFVSRGSVAASRPKSPGRSLYCTNVGTVLKDSDSVPATFSVVRY